MKNSQCAYLSWLYKKSGKDEVQHQPTLANSKYIFFLKWKSPGVTSSRSPSETGSLYKDTVWDKSCLILATFIIRQIHLWTTWCLEPVFKLGLFSHKHFISTHLHLCTSQGGPSSTVPSCYGEGLQSTCSFSLSELLMNKLIWQPQVQKLAAIKHDEPLPDRARHSSWHGLHFWSCHEYYSPATCKSSSKTSS